MSFFWLFFICIYKVTFVSSQTQIIQDFMANLSPWTIRASSAQRTQSGNCENGACIALTQYAIIYRTFTQTVSYKSITLSFYLFPNNELGCAGGTDNRCDAFYAFYSCQSPLYLIEIFGGDDDIRTTTTNGVTNYALASECDNKEVTIYFYSNTYNDAAEIGYVDNVILSGIMDTNINTLTQYDQIFYTELTSTNGISINGNVNIRSDGRYCIPGNCLEMTQTSEISIKYDVSGYHNILLYWDVNIAPDFNLDDNDYFRVLYSCNGGNSFITAKEYLSDGTDPVRRAVSRFFVGENIALDTTCLRIVTINFAFGGNFDSGKFAYLNNIYLFGQKTSSPTKTPTTTPSKIPTQIPSTTPTNDPTRTPTNYPTSNPSTTPTKSPTGTPTKTPSVNPTNNPTNTPTNTPTFTMSPTNMPTVSPLKVPSITPTNSPSNSPSTTPTKSPSKTPSITPTNNPSLPPTSSPSMSPIDGTLAPTQSTIDPTINPTRYPTESPSVSPSVNPTTSPTQTPTIGTVRPTISPTNAPSIATIEPTINPTKAPTISPTNIPTKSTNIPTITPSITPTNNPSRSPSETQTSQAGLFQRINERLYIVIVCIVVVIGCLACLCLVLVGKRLRVIKKELKSMKSQSGVPGAASFTQLSYVDRVRSTSGYSEANKARKSQTEAESDIENDNSTKPINTNHMKIPSALNNEMLTGSGMWMLGEYDQDKNTTNNNNNNVYNIGDVVPVYNGREFMRPKSVHEYDEPQQPNIIQLPNTPTISIMNQGTPDTQSRLSKDILRTQQQMNIMQMQLNSMLANQMGKQSPNIGQSPAFSMNNPVQQFQLPPIQTGVPAPPVHKYNQVNKAKLNENVSFNSSKLTSPSETSEASNDDDESSGSHEDSGETASSDYDDNINNNPKHQQNDTVLVNENIDDNVNNMVQEASDSPLYEDSNENDTSDSEIISKPKPLKYRSNNNISVDSDGIDKQSERHV